jgi:hypothetical protein
MFLGVALVTECRPLRCAVWADHVERGRRSAAMTLRLADLNAVRTIVSWGGHGCTSFRIHSPRGVLRQYMTPKIIVSS